jgi:prephenate dehydrogenase
MKSVAIIGTGLIGASFGLGLRKAGFSGPVWGVSSAGAVKEALAVGAIDRAASLAEAAAECDLLFLAQPIGRILDTLRHLNPLVRPEALVTDAGSTKCEIADLALQEITRCRFLGGHPMAGKERRGAAAADADLFRGATWVLTPEDPGDLASAQARDLIHWLHRLGARPVSMGPEEHDRVVSLTSHLGQLASTALASTVAENLLPAERLAVAGPGLVDMTRLALSSYDLWRDILATNTEPIDRALGAYIQKLEHLRENLRTRQLQEEFERGAELAGRLRKSIAADSVIPNVKLG